jgi:predicted ArsR family transcriptional regulator
MSKQLPESPSVSSADVPLKIDFFLRTLLSYLANTLEDVVGLEDASGFIAVVGNLMGEEINQYYREALNTEYLSPEQVAEVMVDLKRRIEGDFYLISQDSEKIVLGNRACPLGSMVKGHPSLCMMTSSIFGVIAAQNLGYAKVVLDKTIAKGDSGCHVIIYLRPGREANLAEGREYYQI